MFLLALQAFGAMGLSAFSSSNAVSEENGIAVIQRAHELGITHIGTSDITRALPAGMSTSWVRLAVFSHQQGSNWLMSFTRKRHDHWALGAWASKASKDHNLGRVFHHAGKAIKGHRDRSQIATKVQQSL